ncbi:hypothetical protein [Cupriavidus sp. 8B]
MGQIDLDFLPLRVINVDADGKRSFAKGDKRRIGRAAGLPRLTRRCSRTFCSTRARLRSGFIHLIEGSIPDRF